MRRRLLQSLPASAELLVPVVSRPSMAMRRPIVGLQLGVNEVWSCKTSQTWLADTTGDCENPYGTPLFFHYSGPPTIGLPRLVFHEVDRRLPPSELRTQFPNACLKLAEQTDFLLVEMFRGQIFGC